MARSVSAKSPPQATPVRYAILGLSHIAQAAVVQAFSHAKTNSSLTALVSDDPQKLKLLSHQCDVPYCYSYGQYTRCLQEGHIDAVYIALPNKLHCAFTVQAAKAGIHVLCEQPMAVTERECRRMIQAADQADTKLMIASRLHFEEVNMNTVELTPPGKLGKLRFFDSLFTMQVRNDNSRVEAELGGRSLYDIGVYCSNAARYVFQANPTKVSACMVKSPNQHVREVDKMMTACLEFPGHRLATFVCSFGTADISAYEVVAEKRHVRMAPAHEYVGALGQDITLNGKSCTRRYKDRDQLASKLLYFSDCVLNDHNPEPSGLEGLIDVAIVEALSRSAKVGRPVSLSLPEKKQKPTGNQGIARSLLTKPQLIRMTSPAL